MPSPFVPGPSAVVERSTGVAKNLPPNMQKALTKLLGAIAYTFGLEDYRVLAYDVPNSATGKDAAHFDTTLSTATGIDLDVLGQNYGVFRPFQLASNDVDYRRYIQAMAFKRKYVRACIEEITGIIFGDKGVVGWSVHEVEPSIFVVDLGAFVFPSGLGVATYIAPLYYGTLSANANPTDTVLSMDSSTTVVTWTRLPAVGRVLVVGGASPEELDYSSKLRFLNPTPPPTWLYTLNLSSPVTVFHPAGSAVYRCSAMNKTGTYITNTLHPYAGKVYVNGSPTPVDNNSIYLIPGDSVPPSYTDIYKLVRAAGIKVQLKVRGP